MMKSNRGNRLTQAWRCPRCNADIDARTFRFAPGNPSELLCPNPTCGSSFAWRQQNKSKLWPEHRAYSVLR